MKRIMSLILCVLIVFGSACLLSVQAQEQTRPPGEAYWRKCWAMWDPSSDSNVTYNITIYCNDVVIEEAITMETAYDCHLALADAGESLFYFTVTATRKEKRESEASVSNVQYGRHVERIEGSNRYKTSMNIADKVIRYNYGDQPSEVIVLASGNNFPDALSGSFLAIKNYAPILLINAANAAEIRSYVRHHLVDGGRIYVLGGKRAVADEWIGSLASKYNVVRLAGNNRYETNIRILEEAGFAWGNDGTMLVCTGKGYADSLSASSVAYPMLIVGDELTDRQKAYLSERQGSEFKIIGGENAVSRKVEKELDDYGEVLGRIKGNNRYETSKKIAEWFFPDSWYAILATGKNYPDGLCGGPLGNKLFAPILLVENENYNALDVMRNYVYDSNIYDGFALGGVNAVSNAAINNVFSFDFW